MRTVFVMVKLCKIFLKHFKNFQEAKVKSKIPFKCNFCGKKFERSLCSNLFEVRCPKCKEFDVEPLDFSKLFQRPEFHSVKV